MIMRFKRIWTYVFTLVLTGILALIFPLQRVHAGIGVGLGHVVLNKPLPAGGIYKLPQLPVLNTGDQAATYHVFVTYLTGQKELQPDSSWFSFDPQQFTLSPRGVQNVSVTLTLPVSARQGSYFAYLEAAPQITAKGATVGVAAATKLQFQVANTNLFWSLVERVKSFIAVTKPASYYVAGILCLAVAFFIAKRFFHIKIEKKQ